MEKEDFLNEYDLGALKTVLKKEQEIESLKILLIDALNELLEVDRSNDILDLLRDVRKDKFNKVRKSILKSDLENRAEVQPILSEYVQLVSELEASSEQAIANYDAHLLMSRRGLKKILHENENVLNGLLMVNPSIYSKLHSYMTTPIEEHRAKQRKVEDTLYNFVSRASLKTSPFSTVTNVGRVQLAKEDKISASHIKKGIALNYTFVYKLAFHYFVASDRFLMQSKYTLPPFSISENSEGSEYVEFLSKKDDPNRKKIFLQDESLGKLKLPSDIADLFKEKDMDDYIQFKELHACLGNNMKESDTIFMVRKFVEVGLLIPTIGFDERECELFIDDLLTKSQTMLERDKYDELSGFINKTYEIAKKVSGAKCIDEKKSNFNELRALLTEIKEATELEFKQIEVFYEDGYFTNLDQMDKGILDQFMPELKEIQLFTMIFDPSIRLRCELGARLKSRTQKNKLELESEFFSVLFEVSKDMVHYWEDPLFHGKNVFLAEEVIALDDLKLRFIEDLNKICSDHNEEFVDIMSLMDSYVKEIPSDLKEATEFSSSVFAQFNNGHLILNAFYEGNEKYLARFMNYNEKFLDLDPEYEQFLRNHYERGNYYELTDTYGFNGNIKKHRLEQECYTLGVGTRRFSIKSEEKLTKVEDFIIRIPSVGNRLELIDDEGKEVNICFRGSLTPASMPGYISVLLQFFTCGAMYYDFAELVKSTVIPRLQYGNTILNRKRVRFSVFNDQLVKQKKEKDFDYYKRLNSLFLEIGLSPTFFVVIDKEIKLQNKKYLNYKPLFFNIADPLSCKFFERKIVSKFNEDMFNRLLFEEFHSNAESLAKEINFEIYQRGAN
ncbi:hypothetical protein ACI2JA_08045 [Alkalihalobacillus sp. NPDC078783]